MKHLSLLLLLTAVPGYSDLIVTLAPSTRVAAPGGMVTFCGTIENTALVDAFLNDIAFTFTPPAGTYLTADNNFFFANVPGVLLSGETYTGPIFRFVVAPNTPAGIYSGTVSLLGGATDLSFDPFTPTSFAVQMVPEPSTLGLMLAALGVLLTADRRYHHL